jgi:hypothetical protein
MGSSLLFSRTTTVMVREPPEPMVTMEAPATLDGVS